VKTVVATVSNKVSTPGSSSTNPKQEQNEMTNAQGKMEGGIYKIVELITTSLQINAWPIHHVGLQT
jgi:hypothetical protein